MDKHQAQNIIRETFENSFDKERFIRFIKNLLNRIEEAPFTYQGQFIPDAYKAYISSLERIGKFNDGENRIDMLVVKLQKETFLERARIIQRNFIAWYLNGSRGGELKDAALVAFVSPDEKDWRFSLVKMDYKFEQTQTGRMKVTEEFTPARRWSFLVGANENSHTAQIRLVDILANDEHSPTLAELEEAFDIETVTKEFFIKYRELFIRTKEELDKVVTHASSLKDEFESKGVDTVNFAKKLLGQIIFLYFLQKKGWFGVGRDAEWGTGSKHFLRELFEKKHGSYNNFFNDILEPLFYEALRIDRSHDDDYYSRFNCKIPFLNGGLFDPIGNNGGYNWVHTDICLPDSLFSNKNRTKEGDIGDGVLDIFDRYNFTAREDEPLEKEVAIDPELLGKAYEKFNAIRPDNFEEYKKALKSGKKGEESKFNKQYGVYYTPREIVHYMCRQSLINYLYTELIDPNPVRVEDIETLIHLGEQVSENEEIALIKEQKILEGKQKSSDYKLKLPESIRKNASLIDQKLADIAVCDPAVGSGAFPLGMMSEIVKARNVLTAFLSLRGAKATKQSQTGDCFAGARNDHMPGVTQASLSACGDAQAGSLSPKTLTGFETLSGLRSDTPRTTYDFKRQCIENSLYGVDIDPGAVEIAKLRLWLSLVVDEDDIKNIKPLPNLDYKIVCGNSLLGVRRNVFNDHLFSKLEKIKPLYFNETNPTKKQDYKKQIDELISQITNGHKEFDFKIFFSEVFHHKGGFDVVIANPPYGAEIDEITLKKIKQNLSDTTNSNSAAIFIDYGKNRLICEKGTLTFIVPKSLLYSENWFSLVKSMLGNVNILVDIEKAFENVKLEQVVFVYSKSIYTNNYVARKFLDNEFIRSTNVPNDLVLKYKAWICDVSQEELDIAKNLKVDCVYMKDISETKRGVGLQKYLSNDGDYPVIGGKNIFRYGCNGVKGYLSKDILKSVRSKLAFMQQPKIISQDLVAHIQNPIPRIMITSFYDNEGKILGLDTVQNTVITNKDYDCKYILALLNSTFASWYTYKFIYCSAIRTMHFDSYYVGKIPIPKLSRFEQNPFIALVDSILAITKNEGYLQNPDKQAKVHDLEKQIDQKVYNLYNLTSDEIKFVEQK